MCNVLTHIIQMNANVYEIFKANITNAQIHGKTYARNAVKKRKGGREEGRARRKERERE